MDIAYIPFIERFQAFLADVWKYDIAAGRAKLAAWLEVQYKSHSLLRIPFWNPSTKLYYCLWYALLCLQSKGHILGLPFMNDDNLLSNTKLGFQTYITHMQTKILLLVSTEIARKRPRRTSHLY